MTARLEEYPTRQAQAGQVAAIVAADLARALATAGRASLALPGGTTPAGLCEALAGVGLDWAAVTVFVTDERWVPLTDGRSNTGALRRHLLRGAAQAAQVIDLWTGDPDPAEGAARLSARLAGHLPLSSLVLGMGEDLHIAGLFPDIPAAAAAMRADAAPVVAVEGPTTTLGGPPEPRVSLSLPVLAAARHGHLLIQGAAKRAALERALALPPGTDPLRAPVAALLPSLTVHWAP